MKLGIIMPPEAASLKRAKDLGLEFVEFDCNPEDFFGLPVKELAARQEAIKEASQRTGVEVGAVGRWASRILDKNGDVIPQEWENVLAVMDFGQYLGAKHYLCSVAYVEELSYYKNITAAIKVLNQMVAAAAERGMQCSIVNCMMGGNYIRTPEQWKLVLSEVPGLGIKYDPSHSFVHGGAQGAYLDEALEWGSRIQYVHVKGVIQRGPSEEPTMWAIRDLAAAHPELKGIFQPYFEKPNTVYDNPPAGIDVINWRAFFAILYKYGYDGYLAIEPHSATWRGDKGEKGLKYTIKYIRDLMILD